MLRFRLFNMHPLMNHVMAPQAFLHVGLSFATVEIFVNQSLASTPTAQRRFYLPQEPLAPQLAKFWAEHGFPETLTVDSRYLEKILDAKLGGTVAQVVTSGFETWPVLRQPILPNRFDPNPHRQEPLASQDLIFGLSERLDTTGKVLSPVNLQELEFIHSKLKLMGVKRVCVNLLFAQKNPQHQDQVAHFFKEHGFEVFAAHRPQESKDEMPSWRKNVINACLSGAFAEHMEDIRKSFGDKPVKLKFVGDTGQEFLEDRDQVTGSLFAWARLLEKKLSRDYDAVLNLGLENWSLVSFKEPSQFWDSPWGQIEIQSPQIDRLKVQPSQQMGTGHWGGLTWKEEEMGFEPGPISFGRAHKILLFDVLHDHFQLPLQQIQKTGEQRFKDQMSAQMKSQTSMNQMKPQQVSQVMVEKLTDQMAIEFLFLCARQSTRPEKVAISGFFAPQLAPLLKKRLPKFQIQPVSENSL